MPESRAWYYSPKALADLISAAQYIDEESDSSSPGDQLFEVTKETCEHICLFPGIGHVRNDLEPELRSFAMKGFPI